MSKKILSILLVISLALTMSLIGLGCKEETQTSEELEDSVEDGTSTEEVSEEIADETTPEETEEEAEAVELIYWMPVAQEDPHITLFEELNKRVQEKYNITIKFEGQSMDAWYELLTTAGMSQSGPDLLFNWSGISEAISAGRNGLYEPLNDILPEGMFDSVGGWGGATDSDGTIYAVPYDLSFFGLAFNKEMFDQAGIDYSDYPKLMYWDEFTNVCQQLKDAGINPLGYANKEGYYGNWYVGGSIQSAFDSNTEMADYFQNETMNSQPMLDSLEKYKDLYTNGYLLNEGLTLDHTNNTQQQFLGEKVAMQYASAQYYYSYADALGEDKVGMMFWPYFSDEGDLSKGMGNIYNHVIGVTPWCENKEAALLVLQELSATDWGAEKVNEILGYTPSYTGWSPDIAEKDDWQIYVDNVSKLLSEREAAILGYNYWTPEFSTVFLQFNGTFVTGDISAEEFATELDAARGIE